MCGLVGVITKNKYGFNKAQLDSFENLLYVDAVRGEDSTGVFLVTNQGNVHAAKQASDSNQFLKEESYQDVRKKAYGKGLAFIGHNRKATRGSITDENAHPFWVEDKIVLVHNGSLFGDHKHLADVEVDSNAIAHVLANEPDVEKALSQINGAFALIWYDVEQKQLRIVRNDDRPLHWVETPDSYFIASEPGMLYYALWRHGHKIINEGKYFTFKKHELVSYNLDGEIERKQLNCDFRKETPVVGMDKWKNALDKMPAKVEVDYPNDYQPVSYADWKLAVAYRYPQGRRVTVEVNDFIWDVGNPHPDVFLTGHTLDSHGTFVVFRSTIHEVQRITKELGDHPPVYTCVIDQCTWDQVDGVCCEDWESTPGYMKLVGRAPTRIVNYTNLEQ